MDVHPYLEITLILFSLKISGIFCILLLVLSIMLLETQIEICLPANINYELNQNLY